MRRVLFMLSGICLVFFAKAQDITDALRYSSESLEGTARFRSMSGDLSAIYVNPAGSAIYTYGEFAFTFTNYYNKNEATFFGTNTSASRSRFDLGQTGMVFVFDNRGNSDWNKFTMGLTYETTSNYRNDIFIAGINPNNGIDEYFLYYADGVPLDLLQLQEGETIDDLYAFLGRTEGFSAQQAFLGFQSFILEPASFNPNNTDYFSNASYSNGIDQEYSYRTRGANRKFTFNFAGELQKRWYFGVNLNAHVIDYRRDTFLSEIGFDSDSLIQETAFENNLYTYGSGFSFHLGTIFRATESLRLGLSYQSPVWYSLNDELVQGVVTFRLQDDGSEARAVVAPNVVNIYERYRLTTPDKFNASLAYIFGKNGLISVDYIYRNFGNAKLRPSDDPFFQDVNSQIDNELGGSSSFRVGGEYRIKQFSLRAGYRFEGSPYKDGRTVGDLNGYSVGAGYNFGPVSFDIAYDRAKQDFEQQLYQVGLTDRASVTNTQSNFVFTFAIKI